jgi:hypothetical protein
MSTHSAAFLSFACALLAGGVPAQNISRGLYVGAPHMLTVDSDTWDTNGAYRLPTNSVLFKRAGILSSTPLIPFPLPGVPDVGRFMVTVPARIDALSGGFDWVQANDIGEHQSPPLGLGTLTFSVTRETTSAPGGNGQVIFDEKSLSTDGAAADLFSFILSGSTLAPPAWREVTMRAQDSTEISLYGGPGKEGDLKGHDLFLTVFQATPAMIEQVLPLFTGIYFSVCKDPNSIGAIPSSWWNSTPPSGATILWAEWDHALAQFKVPRPFKTFAQLGLNVGDDLIAAAYDADQRHLLFATDRDDIDPLMFAHFDASGNVTNVSTYRMPVTGQPISERMGISLSRRDKIDAICALDPFAPVGGTTFTWSQLFGVPGIGLLPIFPGTGLSASAFRDNEGGSGPENLYTGFTGWPNGGPPQPGLAVALVADPTYTLLLTLGVFTRDPGNLNGDPRQLWIPMPKLPPNSIKLGLHWAVLTGTLIDIAPPAWIDW